jgi:hypothetical protein
LSEELFNAVIIESFVVAVGTGFAVIKSKPAGLAGFEGSGDFWAVLFYLKASFFITTGF